MGTERGGVMYLVYVGESGNTGTSLKDPNQPHHIFLGLMIHEDQWDGIKSEFYQVCHRRFSYNLGEFGTPRELHCSEILQGKGFFSSWPKTTRYQLIDELINILIQRETPLIVSNVDKQEFASAVAKTDSVAGAPLWRGPWEPAFSRFLYVLDLYMDELNTAAMPQEELIRGERVRISERAIIIAEEARRADSELMRECFRTGIDLPTGTVIENLYFVPSRDSHCTQLANICAYIIRRQFHQPSLPNSQYDALKEGRVLEVVYTVQM